MKENIRENGMRTSALVRSVLSVLFRKLDLCLKAVSKNYSERIEEPRRKSSRIANNRFHAPGL
jgi:hypothetical protein